MKKNVLNEAQQSCTMQEILQIIGRLTSNANSLLMNVDNNNMCKQLNNIINKRFLENF